MTPEDLTLSRQECDALLQQGLIEPTISNWTCKAFYVEKILQLKRLKKENGDRLQTSQPFLTR